MNDDFTAAEQVETLLARGMSRDVIDLALRSLSPTTVHVDAPLTNFAQSVKNRDYVADLVLPTIPVTKPSDKYFVWNQANMFEENEVLTLGNEGEPGRVRYRLSTSNYSCDDYGLMDFVSYKEMAAADAPIDPQKYGTQVVVNRLGIAKERRAAAIVFGSSNYGANTSALSGTTCWDNANADPAQAIDDAIEACLVRPNVLVLGAQVWLKLKNHGGIKELILSRAGTTMGSVPLRVTTKLLADAFDLDAVIVGRAKYISTREGQTATYGYIWGKSAALIRTGQGFNPREADVFGCQFEYQKTQIQTIEALIPGLGGGLFVKGTQSVDEVVIAGAAGGYLYTTVVA